VLYIILLLGILSAMILLTGIRLFILKQACLPMEQNTLAH